MTPRSLTTARWRTLVTCAAFVAASVPIVAQSTAPAPSTDQSVSLSKFEVATTQDKGYVSTNAATGFKTDQQLIDIPQAITVVTRDLINDIGANNSSDILVFAGASNFYRGEALAVRGARINNAFVDEVPDNTPYMDSAFIDSYEVIRGPAAVLYMNASLGGAVLKATKKPLPIERTEFTAKMDQFGMYRAEIDSTGPAGKVGDVDVSYRVVGVYQDGDSYFKNVKDKRQAISPVLQFVYKDTTIRVALDYQELDHIPNGNNVLQPDGNIYVGAGRKEAFTAPGGLEHFVRSDQRVALFHTFSPTWEMKLRANHYNFHRLGSVSLVSADNFVTDTINFTARRNKQDYDNWTTLADFSGKYDIANFANQSNFGFSFADELNNARFWSSPTFGTKTRTLSDPQMDSIGLPALSDYVTPPANPGTRAETYRGNFYYQHTLDLIKDRLSLVAGWTYSNITQYSVANIATFPRQEDIIRGTETLHRYGAVLHVTKGIALYALESTTFAPSSSRDINGTLLQPQDGKGQEVGAKWLFFNGKLSATTSVFKIDLTNVAVNVGVNSSGASYFVPVGSTRQQGFDFDLALSVVKGLQVVATGYNGTVKDQNGGHVGNTYGQLYSIFTRYDFDSESVLRGFAVGGGVSRTAKRFVSSAGMVFSDGSTHPLIEVAPASPVNAFATYKYRTWTFRLNVDNVLDRNYVLGLQSFATVDPNPPRTFSVAATYRY